MSALAEVDRDLDQIVVDAARLKAVRNGVAARGKIGIVAADQELAALGNGVTPAARMERARPDTEPPPPQSEARSEADEEEGPPSGQIDVPDDVLASSELPAVLAIQVPHEPLSLEPDSGETPLEDELAPVPTSASAVLPPELLAPVDLPTETRPLVESRLDDPSADLASLLGDSDPMRDEGAVPLAPTEIEPEPTTMFSEADAARFSRPAPAMDELEAELSDVELDLDEVIEMDEEEPEPAAAAPPKPRTQPPPPPPRTQPPPPPGSPGFLGKLLQRKP